MGVAEEREDGGGVVLPLQHPEEREAVGGEGEEVQREQKMRMFQVHTCIHT